MPVKWDETFERRLKRELGRRILMVVADIESQVVRSVSRGQEKRITKSGHMIGLDPSKPGEPPKVLTGQLRQSWSHKVEIHRSEIIGYVISSDKPDKVMNLEATVEEGGLNRPFLRPALYSRRTRGVVRRAFRRVTKSKKR